MIYASVKYEKRYVEVIARHCLDGRVDPLTIVWANGRRFQVERVEKSLRTRCQHTAGYAVRYDVLINRRRKYLYRDEAGWFVEVREDGTFVG